MRSNFQGWQVRARTAKETHRQWPHTLANGRAQSKSPAPLGRATEQAEAQISSPRVSKGCPQRNNYGTLTEPRSQ